MMLPLFVSACGPEIPKPAEPPPIDGATICAETRELRTSHAAALERTQDEAVLMTGAPLILTLDAGCAG